MTIRGSCSCEMCLYKVEHPGFQAVQKVHFTAPTALCPTRCDEQCWHKPGSHSENVYLIKPFVLFFWLPALINLL